MYYFEQYTCFICKQPHPRSGDSQGQETFLTPSDDKKTRNYDMECSNPDTEYSLSKGLSPSKMKWWAIYTNLPVTAIV